MNARALVALIAAAIVTAAATTPVEAQFYFGQNQVQYDRFKWKVIETEHFLIHYYPEEQTATVDAARMAERAYARLSRVLGHQFREKKPLVLYASRSDFGQNNVTGDLGEGTGGVTEALRHRMLLPFTGDYRSFEHVLTHEMVHAFQYDIYARGRAGAGLQELARSPMPLWFAEGMAEYLSLGPGYAITNAAMRDAAVNGRIPTIEMMNERPERYNPYEFGEALWAYIGGRWGDEVVGDIMNAAPSVGIERAFKNELGISLEDLSDEWKETMQQQHLPGIATMERPRKFSQALLTERRTGGEVFLAPSLSDDGKHIAFLSTGDWKRGEVFIDLWLGDARTGKRVKRLVKSTFDPNYEELRLLYSQSAFSPDGSKLAFTSQRKGKDVLNILDVKSRKRLRRLDLPVEGAVSPSWSPDGKRLVFSGNRGGITDLFIVDADGSNLRQLTDDRYGDLQPQWSPDGRTIAFASDRGEATNIDLLRFAFMRISLLDVETGRIEELPNQRGLNINPVWAPDGKSLAFISDRAGTPNLFLYELESKTHFQLTHVVGSVSAVTEYSPAITWARQADRLAFTYYENGSYTVWAIDRPRTLKKSPYKDAPATPGPAVLALNTSGDTTRRAVRPRDATQQYAVDGTDSTRIIVDTTSRRRSMYRSSAGLRPSAAIPGANEARAQEAISVAALLDSASLALPDTTKFKFYNYKVRFQPDYVVRPSIGYAQDNLNGGVFGGTTIVLSDMLGNSRLAFSGEVNGRISEARVFAGYTSLGGRFQYSTGVYQEPLYFLAGETVFQPSPNDIRVNRTYLRYIIRQAFATGIYPLNRFTRFELGGKLNNIDRAAYSLTAFLDGNGYTRGIGRPQVDNLSSLNYVEPFAAYVSDNTLQGYTGPIMGRRYRFEVQQALGSYSWTEYTGDYRRYQPIIFNFLTVAVRGMTSLSIGRDESVFLKYIGYPQFVRGYDRDQVFGSYGPSCGGLSGSSGCRATNLVGSRVALANAELRFPVVRRFELGILPIALPPLDGLLFYDAGVAWNRGQDVRFDRAEEVNPNVRVPVTSYGAGLRLNLFGFAIVRWDYAIPLSQPNRKGFWSWSIGQSF